MKFASRLCDCGGGRCRCGMAVDTGWDKSYLNTTRNYFDILTF